MPHCSTPPISFLTVIRGAPVVPNGLSLCKIHHAAYDENFLGVRPDLVVEVRADVDQIDGPMLRHGLQEMAGYHLLNREPVRAAGSRPARGALRGVPSGRIVGKRGKGARRCGRRRQDGSW